MIKTVKILSSILLSLVITGCPAVSKNIVGLTDYKLDTKKIEGTWINDEGAMLIKVIDQDKGILKIFPLEDKEKIETMKIKIMKGNAFLYFNILPEEESKDNEYIWGRIQINDNRLIFWHASNEAFTRAIDKKIIKGTVKKEKQEDGKFCFTTSSAIITDSAENIINLVESSDKSYFIWDEPSVFFKLTK